MAATAHNRTPQGQETLDRVAESIRDLIRRYYADAQYACVVIHVRDGVPDVVLPVEPE